MHLFRARAQVRRRQCRFNKNSDIIARFGIVTKALKKSLVDALTHFVHSHVAKKRLFRVDVRCKKDQNDSKRNCFFSDRFLKIS